MADDYEVGYGKPPKHTRFRKGQSGNLLGRPKGSTNLQTEMKRLLAAKTKIKVDGVIQTVPTIEGPVSCSHSEGAWPATYAPSPRSSRSSAPRWPTNSKQRPLASHPLTSTSCVALLARDRCSQFRRGLVLNSLINQRRPIDHDYRDFHARRVGRR